MKAKTPDEQMKAEKKRFEQRHNAKPKLFKRTRERVESQKRLRNHGLESSEDGREPWLCRFDCD